MDGDKFHAAARRLVEGDRRADSDAGEPSIPTTTGAIAGVGINGSSSWITATGQFAWWTRPQLTDPSRRRPIAPSPRQPTTIISASLDRSISVGKTPAVTIRPLTQSVTSLGCLLGDPARIAQHFLAIRLGRSAVLGGVGTSGHIAWATRMT